MSFKAFLSALLHTPTAITRCNLCFLNPLLLLSAPAALDDKMSDLDREIQFLREESLISLADRDFVLYLLQNPDLSPGFFSTDTDSRSTLRKKSPDPCFVITVLLADLLGASVPPKLGRETTGLLKLLRQIKSPRQLSQQVVEEERTALTRASYCLNFLNVFKENHRQTHYAPQPINLRQ